MNLDGFTFADLYAGLGAFRLVMEGLGGRCALSSEIDEIARQIYVRNFGGEPGGDIRRMASGDIPRLTILCGGVPCTPFSISGRRTGFAHEDGDLFRHTLRVIRAGEPAAVLIEEVDNLVGHDGGRTLDVILSCLRRSGYVPFWEVLDSSQYGVPTSRTRLYIVAFSKRTEICSFGFPEPTYEPVRLVDLLLPDPQTDEFVLHRTDFHWKRRRMLYGGAACRLELMRIGTYSSGSQGARIYDPRGLAITFTSRGWRQGSSSGAYLINGRVRSLAPREMARVMGFPDDFRLPESYGDCERLLGNTVCVKVVRMIAERMVEALRQAGALGDRSGRGEMAA